MNYENSQGEDSMARYQGMYTFREGGSARDPGSTGGVSAPASAQACLSGVGATHIHPSWHNYASTVLRALPPDRYEITLPDVSLDTRVSFRINDQNFCDLNPTGAVTRNVFANGVELTRNTLTPGVGEEPGFALVVSSGGRVSQ
jgi:hypothetical protein